MEEADPDYRQHVVEARQKAQADYDKILVTLAGGALALSITFAKDIAPLAQEPHLIHWAWYSLSASLLLVLASFCFSRWHLSCTISKIDRGAQDPHRGAWGAFTEGANVLAALALLAGVVFLVLFAKENCGE